VSNVPRFVAYAAAFEKSYANDDWSVVEPFFSEAAVYDARLPEPLGRCCEGRDEILDYFKFVLDGFDRRFESREIALLEGPREEGDSVWIRGSATYRAAGVPDLVLVLDETAWFDGDRIRRLEDRYEPEMVDALVAYLREHGPKLGISLEA